MGHYLHAASAVAVASGDALLRSRCESIVRVLAECQAAAGDGYLSAFPQSEFATVENFQSRAPWVPYYVLLLADLLATHELLGSQEALDAVRLATHIRGRVYRLLARALARGGARPTPHLAACVARRRGVPLHPPGDTSACDVLRHVRARL